MTKKISPTKEAGTPAKAEAFSFGEPVPVLDGSGILDFLMTVDNGRYFEPPVSMSGLAKSFRANAHHSSAIYLKRNILVSTFVPHKWLSAQDFSRWVLDYLIFGNGYLEKVQNRLGSPARLTPALALHMRRMKEVGQYLWLKNWTEEQEFPRDSIFHLLEPDPNQEVYGVPEYLAAMNSAWLNESATLFRRKYYENGSHAGFILYMSDEALEQSEVDMIRTELKKAKGVGNFKNLMVYAPGGKKDGMQVIPISEVTAKDEFYNIKNVTRDDVLAAHRVPPPLMGIVPNNTGGFGSIEAASKVFVLNELTPLQQRFRQLNEWVGEEVVMFKDYELGVKDPVVIPVPAGG